VGHGMQLDHVSYSQYWHTEISLLCLLSLCNALWNDFSWVICITVKGYLQKKIITIMAGAKPRKSCRSLFKKLEILLLLVNIFSLMNFIVLTWNFFRQIQLYTVLTQGIRTVFIDQLPTFHVLSKVFTMLASKYLAVYNLASERFV
jgi:hypothetical protein